jgi:hypothetical protein
MIATGDHHRLLATLAHHGCFAAAATDRWGHRSMEQLAIRTRRERKKGFPKKHSTEAEPSLLLAPSRSKGEGGGGAMDGGGAASPDAAICIAPGPGPVVAVAPAGISKLPQPFPSPLSKRISHSFPIRAISEMINC